MRFKVVVPQTLGTSFGDESRLVLREYTFFISFLIEHPFISYGHSAGWLIDEFPGSHPPKLLELGLDHALPLWPIWGCVCLLQAMAVVSGNYCEGFFFGDTQHTSLLLVWEGVV